MSNRNIILAAAGGAPSGPVDPYFNQTTLLLHGDGTNGAQNNTFLDSSTNNFTITRNGNTTQGTFSPFSEGWSNYFDGTDDRIYTSPGDLTGEFTIECFVTNERSDAVNVYPFSCVANTSGYVYARWTPSTGQFVLYLRVGGVTQTGSFTQAFTPGVWYHIQVTRDASDVARVFIDGTLKATLTANSGTVYTSNFTIGAERSTTTGTVWKGSISNFRILDGVCLNTSSFTAPTTPLTAISGTTLLTCQSNRFVDNSTNNFAITANGNVAVQPFSPFAPSAAYSTSVNGGSGYFDGTGDYLLVADDTALDVEASNFTLEFFYYPLAVQAAGTTLFSKRANTSTFGAFIVYFGGANLTPTLLATNNGGSWGINTASSQSFILNQWNHCAVTRSGDTWKLFVNGVAGITATLSGTVPNNTAALAIGAAAADGSNVTKSCYMSGFRLLKGTAIDFASTGIPTSPPTDITNTSLLCNFTNAGIFDNTGKNNLETVGNAQVDSVSKFGTGSVEFDGTGDKLVTPPSENAVFGTGDFTIECWLYVASNPAQFTCIASNWAGADPSWNLNFSNGSGNIRFNNNGSVFLTSSSAITTGQFVHIAVARSGTSLKMFFDGVEVASATNSTSFGNASTGINIGMYYNNTYPLNGLIDDLRITRGVARYTSAFTPPTAAFPDL